ncbi:WW domain binding protein 4 [Coemansia sp. RSA 1813]|nr:WW domain binding protein 4 [Coemansia sp. RSA 1646]KAJ1771578.1 WW domain binding protein 4 [Coemansia sp. RSA 1843]KAJ2089562.1 WW domain binding protein 4 [Coemansia sp. RSA 986]KAJ2214664.1 WW domain binding protein 4 [Coemansia sp. RSA 487]KAJ2571589.1 WW domain binding protein 4 [Coemansia sp. RSA 1813]
MSSAPYQKKAPWDRNNKYWCQYCRIYVHDNRSSRSIHESGTKHKANVQKYLRQITKDTEAKRKEKQKIALQLETIEKAAEESYRKDIGVGTADGAERFTEITDSIKTTDSPTKAVHSGIDFTHSEEHARAAVGSSEAAQPSRPSNVGIVGAWEVVEEPEDDDNLTKTSIVADLSIEQDSSNGRPGGGQSSLDMRGAEWLDEEDQDHSHNLTDFKIKEKTVGDTSQDEHTGSDPDNAVQKKEETEGGINAAKGLFKKRRVAGNRASSRKQRKI